MTLFPRVASYGSHVHVKRGLLVELREPNSPSLCDPCFGELGPVGETLDSTFVLWEHQKQASYIPETPAPSSQWENWANGSVAGLWASTPECLDQ